MNQMNYNRMSSGCPSRSPAQQPGCEMMNQAQLLKHIGEVSFAVDDILLYLDTHPCDTEALAYANEMVKHRKEAMKIYARRFGPLTIDCTGESGSDRWEWILQPWPWEPVKKGGGR